MRYLFAALALFILAGGVAWSLLRPSTDRVWDVVMMGLPKSLEPRDIEVAPIGYLLNQTHRPLFNQNEDGVYTSEILSDWAQDRGGLNVKVCVKPGMAIHNVGPFDAVKLAEFLKRRLSELKLQATITPAVPCVALSFTQRHHGFFDLFTRFENAPTWKVDHSAFESGLGEFYVANISEDKIELLRKEDSGRGFNKIFVHAYKSKQHLEELIRTQIIEDVNRVSPELVPDEIKKTYRNYGVVLLQTGILLLNVKDANLRRIIYNCLDIQKFRQAFSPGQSEFKNIQTILPIGVPGAREGLPAQNCTHRKNASTTYPTVKFWNWKDNNRESLKSFWKEFTDQTGVQVEYSDISPEKLFAIAKGQERKHELVVLGLSATEFHYRDFYQYLVDPNHSMLSNSTLDLSATLAKLDQKPNKVELESGIATIDSTIASEGLALPLFQQIRQFYYPYELKGISFGSNYLEHPIIAEIRN